MSWLEISVRVFVMFIGFWIAIQCTEMFSWAFSERSYVTKLDRLNDFVFGVIMLSLGLVVMALGFFVKR